MHLLFLVKIEVCLLEFKIDLPLFKTTNWKWFKFELFSTSMPMAYRTSWPPGLSNVQGFQNPYDMYAGPYLFGWALLSWRVNK